VAFSANETTVWVLAGVGVLALLYMINQNTDGGGPIPEIQGEAQVLGLGAQAGMRVEAGSALDVSQHHHGWHPGYDPDPTGQPVTLSKHRYPALPGGNISTVMHKGWSSCRTDAPNGMNDWFVNPPEAAVL
jgi:hypothetical protein